jgi:hypothetical protein
MRIWPVRDGAAVGLLVLFLCVGGYAEALIAMVGLLGLVMGSRGHEKRGEAINEIAAARHEVPEGMREGTVRMMVSELKWSTSQMIVGSVLACLSAAALFLRMCFD